MRHGLIQEVTEAIENELSAANKAFPGFNSTHEGYAVILEEAQEKEDEKAEAKNKRERERQKEKEKKQEEQENPEIGDKPEGSNV